jgi:hypothetical protein
MSSTPGHGHVCKAGCMTKLGTAGSHSTIRQCSLCSSPSTVLAQHCHQHRRWEGLMAVVLCGYACIQCMHGEHSHIPWLCDAHEIFELGKEVWLADWIETVHSKKSALRFGTFQAGQSEPARISPSRDADVDWAPPAISGLIWGPCPVHAAVMSAEQAALLAVSWYPLKVTVTAPPASKPMPERAQDTHEAQWLSGLGWHRVPSVAFSWLKQVTSHYG